jgi:toxin-antitoxin system PIN domain toxin
MTSSVFLDVNVWLALSTGDHAHFESAWAWYKSLPGITVLLFCRITQLGFLRLLTTQSVMGKGTLSQAQAWGAYERMLTGGGAKFAEEPAGLESAFRALSSAQQVSPKEWADAYLAAFSAAAEIPLITFDRTLAGKAKGSVLLS